MDEPFAALDAQTRNFMQLELLCTWKETKNTGTFVTHMISEAIFLSGTIRSKFQVPLERPRNMEIRSELKNVVWKQIEKDVNASGSFTQM